jgi:hypothetical protein
MSSDVIRHCQSPTEKVSKVWLWLSVYCLTYWHIFLYLKIFIIFGHEIYELAFKVTSNWHYVNLKNQKMFRRRFLFFFNWRNFRFECTVFKIQKLSLYLSHTTGSKIDFHILYSTQRIFQSTSAPSRKAEVSIPKTSFYCFRTATVSALTVFPSYCRNLCSWYVDNVLVICSRWLVRNAKNELIYIWPRFPAVIICLFFPSSSSLHKDPSTLKARIESDFNNMHRGTRSHIFATKKAIEYTSVTHSLRHQTTHQCNEDNNWVHYVIILTLVMLTWRIWWAPNNANKWQMGFNLMFKGLIANAERTVAS